MNELLLSDLDQARGDIKKVIEVLKLAINDWPKPISELDVYESEVRNFIGSQVTKKTVNFILTDIDLSKYAWQAESLTQLIDVFSHYNDGLTLKDIIRDIREQLA